LAEIAFISAPVGMNVHAIAGMARDVPLHHIFLGIRTFAIADIVTLTLLMIFPQITLFLPGTM
jgi:TRAP-type C4-dicarboxylate transport system permease large subunit